MPHPRGGTFPPPTVRLFPNDALARYPDSAVQGRRPHHPSRDPARLLAQAAAAARALRGRRRLEASTGCTSARRRSTSGSTSTRARSTSTPTCRPSRPRSAGFISLLARDPRRRRARRHRPGARRPPRPARPERDAGHEPHSGTHRHPVPDQALRGRRRLMLGVLELAGRGAGFLRRREAGYLPVERGHPRRRAGHPPVRAPRGRRDRRRDPSRRQGPERDARKGHRHRRPPARRGARPPRLQPASARSIPTSSSASSANWSARASPTSPTA